MIDHLLRHHLHLLQYTGLQITHRSSPPPVLRLAFLWLCWTSGSRSWDQHNSEEIEISSTSWNTSAVFQVFEGLVEIPLKTSNIMPKLKYLRYLCSGEAFLPLGSKMERPWLLLLGSLIDTTYWRKSEMCKKQIDKTMQNIQNIQNMKNMQNMQNIIETTCWPKCG